MQMIRFIIAAFTAGVVYVDCDGCVLKKFPVPDLVPRVFALLWWRIHLQPTKIVKRRLPLLYFLRLYGVRLVLWTNRMPRHRELTIESLGAHAWLFDELRFRDGFKIQDRLDGPVMDDERIYLSCGKGRGLLVSSVS